ncbi:MAG TPA: histidine kinase, partial [Actinomycetota bacterium]|nr:histidine kinase [Actinomycetota bacterium]
MTDRGARRLAWGLWLVGLVTFLLAEIHHLASHGLHANDFSEPVAFASIGVVGLIVALHQPRNAIGWIYLAVWIGAAGVFAGLQEYAYWAETSRPGAPGASLANWLVSWGWVPIFTMLLTYPFLLFPDGHLPSRRWRPVAWAIGVAGALWSVTFALDNTGDYTDALNRQIRNPYAPAPPTPLLNDARLLLSFVVLGLMAATIVSLLLRYRRSEGEQRAQIRWLLYAGGVTLVWFLLPVEHGIGGWIDFVQGLVLTLIPIAVAIAILKYRLYDVDVVINKTVVFAVLAGFITVIYVAIVVGVGTLIGSRGSPVLSGVAAAAVALAFQPVRRWGQRVANRFVYGKRATPYEVLSEFSDRLAGAYAEEDLLPRMARILAEGTGAARADVWLRAGSTLHVAATFPADAPARDDVEVAASPADVRPVAHQGELLGGLSIEKRPGEALTPTEDKLIGDLAGQAGLVLRNAALIADLRSSRQRLVAAQDEERRKIERNIHDGAQQQLVALAVQLKLAEQLVGRDPDKERELLATLGSQANGALEDLRDLARGIYPPLLADQGLRAALEAQARKAALPVRVEGDGIGRFPQDVEATVYFCTLEALNNVAKYAEATSATVRLSNGSGTLRFEV